jgi:hypothetical protein
MRITIHLQKIIVILNSFFFINFDKIKFICDKKNFFGPQLKNPGIGSIEPF